MKLVLVPKDKTFDVFYNKIGVGRFYQEVDGYYVYTPNLCQGGFVDAVFLRAMADKLDEINKPWHDEVCKTLNSAKAPGPPKENFCCHTCWQKTGHLYLTRMILCPVCGNKRCPKASDHTNACTGSNDPGQPGSIY